jgi:tRNA A-37 threonylcarbamoyl transferase component Bud32
MSGSQDDLLFGKIALNMHYITKERLEQALNYQKTRAPNVPLGEILLQYRLLSREQIDRIIEFQQRVKNSMSRAQVPTGMNGAPMASDSWAGYQQALAAATPVSAPTTPAASGFLRAPGSQSQPMVVVPAALSETRTEPPPPDALLSQTIGGCVIVAKIGEGGMGAIYRARHEALRKDVVVKVLSPESAANERTVKRFFREAQAAAKLEHPNIVQVLNVGTTERGLHFIVMQYIDGQNLEDVIVAKGRHPWREALRIVVEVGRGLQAAHNAGVIHRDIKAENILITSQGVVKLADFGLAKDLNSDMKLTADGAMIGTPLYMAPEIGRVKEIDGRVDIYSLGVTFYYLLTGVQPFRDFTAIEILAAKAHDRLKPPEQFTPDLPEPVRNVLGKMLEKDRDKRYHDMESLLRELDALDRGLPVSAGEPLLWGSSAATPAANAAKSAKAVGVASSRKMKVTSAIVRTSDAPPASGYPPLLIVAFAFAGVLALGLGVVFLIVYFWK